MAPDRTEDDLRRGVRRVCVLVAALAVTAALPVLAMPLWMAHDLCASAEDACTGDYD